MKKLAFYIQVIASATTASNVHDKIADLASLGSNAEATHLACRKR